MATPVTLESPAQVSDLYLARGADDLSTFVSRPVFTGDIFELGSSRIVALVQHPCAMRRGTELSPKLLICGTKELAQYPTNWSKGHFRRMFLPEILGNDLSIEFDDLDVISREEILAAKRIAILTETGVNLLVQRWLHHNSRVIVPTITIHAQTTGPFEEADLTGEAVDDLIELGQLAEEAVRIVDEWLGQSHLGTGPSRREMLNEPQSRGTIRSALRRHVREFVL